MAIPERNMIVVAVTLAILEKFSGLLGTLNFIWATTVLLGGYASDLVGRHFWIVTGILVIEGIRIFGRWGEVHTSSHHWLLMDRIRYFSFIIQEGSAAIVIILSVKARPVRYGSSNQARNRNLAIKLFFLVATIESFLVLVLLLVKILAGIYAGREDIIVRWITRVSEVKEWYNLAASQNSTLCRFFHHTYSRCVSGSIFDSWKMTIVSYSVELLQSSDGVAQLNGATLLWGLVQKDPRALERLRSIGTIRNVVEMLIDMLNWDSNELTDQKIRVAAAEIILNLVWIGRNRTLVMAAPDSMESIASLLYDGNQVENNSEYRKLSRTGLCILNELANDHDNRAKMGSNRGLLLKIITLTESNAPELDLKKLAIDTLTSIAREQEFRESIGGIDGVLHTFLSLIFANINIDIDDEKELVSTAGEALGFLSLENHHNCEIMMNFPYLIPDLISVLNDPTQGIYAARILRNLYAYLEAKSDELEANSDESEANNDNLNAIREASAEVVALVMNTEGVHQEAAIGLAAQIFKFPSQADYELVFGEQYPSLISKLRDVLQQYPSPSKELPNIRRFSILLLIAVMKMDIRPIIRNELHMDLILNALEGAMNTTSVLESYSTFSGTIGLTSHRMSIPFLAHSAMDLLHRDPTRRHYPARRMP